MFWKVNSFAAEVWKPVPPKGNIQTEEDALRSLFQENAKDLVERYKRNTARGRNIKELETTVSQGITIEGEEKDLTYDLKLDIIKGKAHLEAEYERLKFLLEAGIGKEPTASMNYEDKFIRHNIKREEVTFGLKKEW